jgi:myo-inositol-1(or 4)-monophosphatase
MTSNDTLTAALSLAKEAARKSAERLGALLTLPIDVESSVNRDVKLKADRDAEDVIVSILRESSPHAVLSEESGWIEGSQTDGLRWIVDPLDGSFNFLRGIPVCCVSIALWRDDEPLLGVIHDIHSGEAFSGIVGRGAWLGSASIHVSSIDKPSNAVMCTGYPVSTDFSRSALLQYVEQVRGYKKIRLLGSAALSLAYLAAGRVDAYYERGIKIWDVAAGLAIVKAAGGAIAHTAVDPAAHIFIVEASNGLLTHASVQS